MAMTTKEGEIIERRRGRVIASPRARRAMRQRGISPGAIRGSGPGGRIVEADVLRASAHSALWCGLPTAPPGGPKVSRVEEETCGLASAGSGDPRRALVGVAPHFWLQATADVASLLSVQSQIDEDVRRACGTPLRLTDLLLRAVALALAECPEANRVWQGETLAARTAADVGFEVEVPGGQAFAVIRQADRLRLLDLVARRAELAKAALARRLPPEAAQGAAIALSDLSDFPIDQYVAAVVPPYTSVVAVGRPALWCGLPALWCGLPTAPPDGPKVSRIGEETFGRASAGSGDPRRALTAPRSGDPRRALARQTLSVCLTADRRAVAPETAAKLLGRIVEFLQSPFLLLCERQPR